MTRPLFAALALALAVGPAGADETPRTSDGLEPGTLGTLPIVVHSDPVLDQRPAPAEEPESTATTERDDASGAEARSRDHAVGLGPVGVFAHGERFPIPRDGRALDLRGGAYLHLLRNVMLRGSYRLFDYDRYATSDLDIEFRGPFLGLMLSF